MTTPPPEPDDAASVEAPPGDAPRPSGLRNPQAAMVLLLAIQPIRIMGGELSGWGIAAVVTLAVLAGALAGMMRRPWAWHGGTAVQVLLICSGLLHWSLAVLGLLFGGAWAYAGYVRRSILG
jgi:hypothetical protein